MRGLFFKVFVILWIAQSLIVVISTAFIVRRHFERPDVMYDAFHNTLRNDASKSLAAFEATGCAGVRDYAATNSFTATLTTPAGQDLCSTPGAPALPADALTQEITGRQVGMQYVWSAPVTSAVSGKQYFFLRFRPHTPDKPDWTHDLQRFSFPQLPVAIVVGGVTTFVLVLLVTRPVVRLRKAARELAQGNLSTRVTAPAAQLGMFEGDEIQALAHDFNFMAERLESLVSAQQLLLRDVSHELRSPLARLAVALELAREDEDPEMASHLERIERETQTLNQLIGQLLTLSSMEAMERITNFEPLSLNQVIEEMIPDASYEAKQRQCSVIFHPDSQCILLGNQQLIHRAVENILRNAIRYTPAGSEVGITLTVATEHDRKMAVLEINDSGPGIPANELDSIFLPFYRVDLARSPDTGGFGVGLAIAVRAVKLHGGELRAFNRAEGGATIRMRLPLLESWPGAEQHPPRDPQLSSVELPNRSSAR